MSYTGEEPIDVGNYKVVAFLESGTWTVSSGSYPFSLTGVFLGGGV